VRLYFPNFSFEITNEVEKTWPTLSSAMLLIAEMPFIHQLRKGQLLRWKFQRWACQRPLTPM